MSPALFLLSRSTGISEAASNGELALSPRSTRSSPLLPTILSQNSAAAAQGRAPRRRSVTFWGCTSKTRASSPRASMLTHQAGMLLLPAPIQACHIAGKGSDASAQPMTYGWCPEALGWRRTVLALPAPSPAGRTAAGCSTVMQEGAGKGWDLTCVFWGLSLRVLEHSHRLPIHVEVGNASYATGRRAFIYTNVSFYVLT